MTSPTPPTPSPADVERLEDLLDRFSDELRNLAIIDDTMGGGFAKNVETFNAEPLPIWDYCVKQARAQGDRRRAQEQDE